MTDPNRTPAPGEAALLADEAKLWISQVCIAAHRRSPAQTKVAVEALEAFIDKPEALAPQPAQGVQAAGDAVAEVNNIGMLKATQRGCEVLKAGDKLYLAAPTVADRVPLTEAEIRAFAWIDELNVSAYYASRIGAAVAYLKRHGIGAEKTGEEK